MIDFKTRKGAADLVETRQGFALYSCVFYRSTQPDFERGIIEVLPLSCSDEELGGSLRRCLEASRKVHPDDPIFNGRTYMERYEAWFADLMRELGFSKQRQFYQRAKSPTCQMTAKQIELRPTIQERVGGFSGYEKTSPKHGLRVHVERSSDAAVIGKSVRECLSLCE